jgi:hypothetical protein
MTNLDKRPVKRETRAIDTTRSGRRPFVVLLEVGGRVLRIKPKGTRHWYTVPYEEIYRAGVRIRSQELKTARAEAKAAKKK